MKYTNKNNYPDYVEKWLKTDDYDYDPNTFSATELMQPTRVLLLKRLFKDILEVDVDSRMASRYGTAMHESFEKVSLLNSIREQRMSTIIGGAKITGKADLIKNLNSEPMLVDYKTTSAWTYIIGDRVQDYVKQLSIYRLLAIRNGINVGRKAEICMIFTDWSKSQSRQIDDYPDTRIKIKEIILDNQGSVKRWVENRIKMISFELQKYDDSYKISGPTITQEGMIRCPDDQLWMNKGKPNRCNYCDCANICVQRKEMLGKEE